MSFVALLRRHPMFARMWVAEAISLAGDWFSLVAICALAAEDGAGGALAVAMTLVAHELPSALMRPIAGVMADRFDRRNLLLGIHIGQALLTLAMVERAVARDLVGLQALVFLRSTFGGLDWPARSGAIRRLVPAEDALEAFALGGATWSAMYAVGMALGGIVSSFGVPLALGVDALSFVGAAVLLATLPPMPTRGIADIALKDAVGAAVGDLREAIAHAWSDGPRLRAVLSKTPLGLAGGVGVVALNLVAASSTLTAASAATLGLLQASRGIGTGIGPWVASRGVSAGWPMITVWRVTTWTGFLGVAAFALPLPGWTPVLAALLWGCGTGANWMISGAEVQRLSDDDTIGRLSGLDFLCVELAFALSALVGGLVIEGTGQVAAGVGVGLTAGIGFWAWIQAVAR